MWAFLFNREALQERLGEGTFVTGLFVLKNKSDGTLHTVSIWPENIPIVLAPCNYMLIKKKYRSLFREVEEAGLVSYETIMKELGHYFDDYEEAGTGVKILTQANADRMEKIFNKLKIFKPTEEFGSMLAKDSFVNAKPV